MCFSNYQPLLQFNYTIESIQLLARLDQEDVQAKDWVYVDHMITYRYFRRVNLEKIPSGRDSIAFDVNILKSVLNKYQVSYIN